MKAAKEPNLYEVLGCSPNSTTEQIQAEYKVRVLQVHPDKQQDKGDEGFQLLQRAKEILTNPSKRKHYDTYLSIGSELPLNEWMTNQERFQQTFHWAAPTQPTPAIASGEIKSATGLSNKDVDTRWSERHTSANINAFRNYEI
ncbi:J domain-containing protein [Aphelenchoides bicaudatus]|nr:J domain-containing protein [Aphelenchoides bicaudatus]